MFLEYMMSPGITYAIPTNTDVFSPDVYTGTGGVRTVTTNVDLTSADSGSLRQGGMVWIRSRSNTSGGFVFDTTRGALFYVDMPNTVGSTSLANSLTAFSTTGYSLGSASAVNGSPDTFVSWTFRKARRFFDVVTYTGDGVSGRQIAHSLGTTPGMYMVRRTSSSNNWYMWHTSLASGTYASPSQATAATADSTVFSTSSPTSATFPVGTNAATNAVGATYVAYIFADTVGLCKAGTYSGSASDVTVTCGFAPRFVIVKRTDSATQWRVADTARGLIAGNDPYVSTANTTAETTTLDWIDPVSGGFTVVAGISESNTSGGTYIYYAVA